MLYMLWISDRFHAKLAQVRENYCARYALDTEQQLVDLAVEMVLLQNQIIAAMGVDLIAHITIVQVMVVA